MLLPMCYPGSGRRLTRRRLLYHCMLISTRLQSVLIRLENVQFIATDTAKTYADPVNQISENRTWKMNMVIQCWCEPMALPILRVKVPNGSIIAIASQYSDDRQLIIRHL